MVMICVLLKPSILRGTVIYYHSGEDNHVVLLSLYPLILFSEQQKFETANNVVEILNSTCYAV